MQDSVRYVNLYAYLPEEDPFSNRAMHHDIEWLQNRSEYVWENVRVLRKCLTLPGGRNANVVDETVMEAPRMQGNGFKVWALL